MKTKTWSKLPFIVFVLLVAASAGAFKIDFLSTYVPAKNISHAGKPVHEEITRDAITNVSPQIKPAVILNLQYGVQNPDVIHTFDSESHFDNSSVALNVGFSAGFSMMTNRIAAARRQAMGNSEFLDPHFTNFLAIATDVAAALGAMAVDPECLLKPGCPTAKSAEDAALIGSFLPALAGNPNPDPHRATNPRSLFHSPPDPACQAAGFGLCGYFGPVQEAFLGILDKVEDVVNDALGDHFDPSCACNRNLEAVLGSSNAYVVRLKRLANSIRAYHAYQDLGHSMHAAQDFFAHSDYVELMAGVAVGQQIPAGTAIALPPDFAQFNLAGLQTVMGLTRYNQLESGDVLTIWLGEGDYSLGDAGILNLFNPATAQEIGGFSVLDFNIPPVTVPPVGRNPNPFPGFHHGHYRSSTALGLNKDCAFDTTIQDEQAHRNFPAARQAAVQMTALLWSNFLRSIGEIPTPVTLTCPPGRSVSTAAGQCSAAVTLGMPAASGGCGPLRLTNDAPARFPKGTNFVRWTASDECGNHASCNQVVVVADREAPHITCSTNPVVAATSSTGAIVVFPLPAATDNCSAVRVTCVPSSGTRFPIGTNNVHCTAVDESGNQADCTFKIRVKGAADQIRDLVTAVNQSSMPAGIKSSFLAQLRDALSALTAGSTAEACADLSTFIGHANAQSGKKTTTTEAAAFVAAARQIRVVLNCP